jgi:hypothetical protein
MHARTPRAAGATPVARLMHALESGGFGADPGADSGTGGSVRTLAPGGMNMKAPSVLAAGLALWSMVSTASAQCVGDCHGDGRVTIDELLLMVNIALDNTSITMCQAGDHNGNGAISVDEIVSAVHAALVGCPVSASPDLEKAAGVATSTLVALLTALTALPTLDLGGGAGIAAAAPATRATPGTRLAVTSALNNYRGLSAGDAAATEACPGGGTIKVTCKESGGSSVLSVVMKNCGIPDDTSDLLVTSNGSLTITIAARGVCASGEIPSNVRMSTRYVGFTARSTDSQGVVHTSVSLPDFTATLDPTGAGCAGPDGTVTLNGTFSVTATDTGVDLTGTAHSVSLQVSSSGEPCNLLEVTAKGRLDLTDRLNDRRFSAAFTSTNATFRKAADQTETSALDGPMTVDCLGTVTFATVEPLQQSADGCAVAGQLLVVLADGTNGRVVFLASGGVAFDYNADGTPDMTVSDCHDPSVHQCR